MTHPLQWKKYPVLNDGYITLVDVMGDDSSIVQAARVSYGKDTRDPLIEDNDTSLSERDRNLIRYLLNHSHCYRGDMQVLTTNGWKRWDQLKENESFLVPDPDTKTLKKETLKVVSFDIDEELYCFKNKRMSYAVTNNHTMYFKRKYETNYMKYPVQNIPVWGHFEPSANYIYLLANADKQFEFIGFYLGDGSRISRNRIQFHLKKQRKVDYLLNLCILLNLEVSITDGWNGAQTFTIETPDWLRETVELNSTTKKLIEMDLSNYKQNQLVGLFYGLINSDGSKNKERVGQINFSSVSHHLIHIFETVASMLHFDCHRVSGGPGIRVTAYRRGRTSLESRKQYHYREHYTGKVYCTTTSTGLLLVRGSSNEFGFVCGNSTPFEMVEFKFLVRVPMDCWRQWVRHRTANINEYSTRYTEAIDSQQITLPGEWRLQATDNKQGSSGFLEENHGLHLSSKETHFHHLSQKLYKERLNAGIAKEQARKDLPLSTYTEAYWKCDLHNIFNFLRLRMDSHAQYEIRMYANAMAEIVKQVVPVAWEAFEDYVLYAKKFSRMEMELIREQYAQLAHYWKMHTKQPTQKPDSMTDREWRSFLEKLS